MCLGSQMVRLVRQTDRKEAGIRARPSGSRINPRPGGGRKKKAGPPHGSQKIAALPCSTQCRNDESCTGENGHLTNASCPCRAAFAHMHKAACAWRPPVGWHQRVVSANWRAGPCMLKAVVCPLQHHGICAPGRTPSSGKACRRLGQLGGGGAAVGAPAGHAAAHCLWLRLLPRAVACC